MTALSPDRTISSESFLRLDSHPRRVILQQLGLLRYADFLVQMSLTEANVDCVRRFLSAPERVKFPQLQGADLANLCLNGSNLIRADLSGTNLSNAQLQSADLLFARAIAADLRGADLRGATLSRTDWTDAKVEGCQFGSGNGLTSVQINDLCDRGGQFE